MKSLIFILLISIVSVKLYCQTPVLTWEKTIGNSYLNSIYDVDLTEDNGKIMAGLSYDNNSSHGWFIKLDSSDEMEWEVILPQGNSYGSSALQTEDGGYIMSAGTNFNLNYWILKYSSGGEVEWEKTFGGSGIDISYSVIQTSEGGYIVVGSSDSIDGDNTENEEGNHCWVIKLDSIGNIEWKKSYAFNETDIGKVIRQTSDGGFIIGGLAVSEYPYNQDILLFKIDFSGEVEWANNYGSEEFDEYFNDIIQTNDGGYICVSNDDLQESGSINSDLSVMKLNSFGEAQWQYYFGGDMSDSPKSILQMPDSGFLISGISTSNNGDLTQNRGGFDCWVLKLNQLGEMIWQKSFGGSSRDECIAIFPTSENEYKFYGNTSSNDGDISNHFGSDDVWLGKLEVIPFDASLTNLSLGDLECQSNFSPQAVLTNLSVENPIFSVELSYKLNDGEPLIFEWNGELAPGQSELISLPEITAAFGQNNYNVRIIKINDLFDIGLDNNWEDINFTVSTDFITHQLILNLSTDNFGSETSWVLKNSSGEIVYEGNNYENNTDYEIVLELSDSDCYEFIIWDSDGNGICCENGNGSYSLATYQGDIVILGGEFDDSESISFHIEFLPLSLSDILNPKLELSPNPVNDFLYLKSTEIIKEIDVYDVSGKKVFNNSINKTESKINFQNLEKGIYFILVKSEHKVSSHKIIKK